MILNKIRLILALSILPAFVLGQKHTDIIISEESLDIVSWNLRYFPFSRKTSTYVSNIINNNRFEIIAFQEIKSKKKFEELLSLLPNYIGYRANPDEVTNPNNLALAYLFNNSVNVTKLYEIFAEDKSLFSRPPLVIELIYDEKKFVIINTHLKAHGDGKLNRKNERDSEYIRLRSLQKIKEFMDSFYNVGVILLGDFNDQLSDKKEDNVFIDYIDDKNYFLADLFIELGNKSNWSCPAADYNKDGIKESSIFHLDHFITKNIIDSNILVEVYNSKDLGLDDSEYFNHISDHKPVKISISRIINEIEKKESIKNPKRPKLLFDLSYLLSGGKLIDTKSRLHKYQKENYNEIFYLKNTESLITYCTKHFELENIQKTRRVHLSTGIKNFYKITKAMNDK